MLNRTVRKNHLVKPELFIVAGPNGSGKTTITRSLIAGNEEKFVYINPDQIAQEKFQGWNDKESIIKAAIEADRQRHLCLEKKQSFLFETVFSAPDKLDFIKKAKEKGFKVTMFFVGTNSPSINVSRVCTRVTNGEHNVPVEKILSRYFKSIAQLKEAIPYLDECHIFDNSVDGQSAQYVMQIQNGKNIKIFTENIPNWIAVIKDFVSLRPKPSFSDKNKTVIFPKK